MRLAFAGPELDEFYEIVHCSFVSGEKGIIQLRIFSESGRSRIKSEIKFDIPSPLSEFSKIRR